MGAHRLGHGLVEISAVPKGEIIGEHGTFFVRQ